QNGSRFESLAPGVYTAYVRDKSDPENLVQKTFTIAPAAHETPPTPTITIQGEDGISQEVALVSSSDTGNQWLKDGVAIQGATAQTLAITEAGTYQVQVSNSGGCSSVSANVAVTSL